MARCQLIGLHHARPGADGKVAVVKRALKGAFRRLPAPPRVGLVDEHVVFDVPDRQRPLVADPLQDGADLSRRHRSEPILGATAMALHLRSEETNVRRRHIGERVCPILENALVDGLRGAEVLASIVWNSCPQDVMMAALDNVDRVDLHVAELSDRSRSRHNTHAEGRQTVKALGAEPSATGGRQGERHDSPGWRRHQRSFAGGARSATGLAVTIPGELAGMTTLLHCLYLCRHGYDTIVEHEALHRSSRIGVR